jgi:HK97 family phage portal protein
MDVLGYLLGSDLHAGTPGPTDDFWYCDTPSGTPSGMRVSSEGARKLSAWFRGRDLLATSLAMLPLQVFRRLPNDEGAEVAREHPLYDTIHTKPNTWQDAFGWRRQAMYHLIDHGNAYNRIIGGRRGFAEELHPLDPTLVTPEQLPSKRIVYHVRDLASGLTTRYSQDDIFHLRGASDDGVVGKGILQYAKDNLGTALSTESYSAAIFGKGTLSGGYVKVPGGMTPEHEERMRRALTTKPGEWHTPKILINGAEFTESKLTPEAAQMILSKKHSVDDIARWLGVPRHMLDNSDPSFGNAEQFNQNFVTFSLGPWLSLFEFGITDQLIIQNDTYYAEFVRDALVRGDIAARWAAYVDAVTTGTYTRNEVRRMENKRALPGLDKPLDPAHLTGKQRQTAQRPNMEPQNDAVIDDDTEARLAQAHAIAVASATRLLRKETAAMQRLAVKHAASGPDFTAAVVEFYGKHAKLVGETLHIARGAAETYCSSQSTQARADWVRACELWGTTNYALGLAALALEPTDAV